MWSLSPWNVKEIRWNMQPIPLEVKENTAFDSNQTGCLDPALYVPYLQYGKDQGGDW
jgi:hypothetical protein